MNRNQMLTAIACAIAFLFGCVASADDAKPKKKQKKLDAAIEKRIEQEVESRLAKERGYNEKIGAKTNRILDKVNADNERALARGSAPVQSQKEFDRRLKLLREKGLEALELDDARIAKKLQGDVVVVVQPKPPTKAELEFALAVERHQRAVENLYGGQALAETQVALNATRQELKSCQTKCCEKDSQAIIGGFNLSNACGSSANYKESSFKNRSCAEVLHEQQSRDLAFNKVVGAMSWGCHVRPEPQMIVIQQAAPAARPWCCGITHNGPECGSPGVVGATFVAPAPYNCYRPGYPCHRYGYPAPAPYYQGPVVGPGAMIQAPPPGIPLGAVQDGRNPVVMLPPGVPNPGCSCPGHAPGEPCHCGPNCRTCQGCGTRT